MNTQKESPCIECPNMVNCSKMCYERLEWGVFEAKLDDEELVIYGNNIEIKDKCKSNDNNDEVKVLLKEFNKLYRQVVLGNRKIEK